LENLTQFPKISNCEVKNNGGDMQTIVYVLGDIGPEGGFRINGTFCGNGNSLKAWRF
jgi:hypothetical protein